MKHIFIVSILSIILLFTLFIPSFAQHYTPYASVTSSTSQINLLIETMYNQPNYDSFKDWVAIRVGQYDYSLFYNIQDGNCDRLRYYGINQSYNTDWYLSHTQESNFSYSAGNYTVVGNMPDSLGASSYRQQHYEFILMMSVPAILIVILFFVFRIRKNKRSISI